MGNLAKKGTLKTQNSQIAILVLNQSRLMRFFQLMQFAGYQKTTLSRESLYLCDNPSASILHVHVGGMARRRHTRALQPNDRSQINTTGSLGPYKVI